MIVPCSIPIASNSLVKVKEVDSVDSSSTCFDSELHLKCQLDRNNKTPQATPCCSTLIVSVSRFRSL